MKRCVILWAMSFLCMAMPVKAENEDPYIQLIDGFYYYLTSSSAVLTRAFNIQYNDMEVVRIPDTVYYKGKSYAVRGLDSNVFSECDRIKSVTLPRAIRKISDGAFEKCSRLTSINLENVQEIGDRAFFQCGLTEISLDGVSIGYQSFTACALKSIKIPGTWTSISDYLFAGCPFTDLVIPDNIKTIGEFAFSNVDLRILTIGRGVTRIDEGAFICHNLDTVKILAVTPPDGSEYMFGPNDYAYATLYVPNGSLQAYRNATGWSNFQNIREMPSTGMTGVDEDLVKVYASEGSIVVSGAESGRSGTGYNTAGIVVRETVVPADGRVEIALPAGAMYIVNVGGTTRKVVL